MKPTPLKQKGAPDGRNVMDGDVLYYRHKTHGPTSGRVICSGAHGVTIDHGDGPQQVVWDDILGHKARRERKLTLVERGEDGGIATDEDGNRVFVEGELPEDDGEKLNKALTEGPVQAEPALSLRDRAAIDVALMAAGYEPTLEYVRATYGEHWSRRAGPAAPRYDDGELVKSIADARAHSDAGVAAVRSELAMLASSMAVALGKLGGGDAG